MNGKGQGWIAAGNLVKNLRYQRLHFEVKCSKKTLAGRARWVSLSVPPETPSRSGCHGMVHSLSQLGALCGEEGAEMN